MGDGILGTDLFGDPVLPRQEGRGRPEHQWTREKSNQVLLAFWRGLSVKDAAAIVGISAPTLRRVYFSEVAQRKVARLKGEMLQLARLNDQAEKGNVAAEKELGKMIERLRLRDQGEVFTAAPTAKPNKAPKLGKKEERVAAAREWPREGEWGPLLKH